MSSDVITKDTKKQFYGMGISLIEDEHLHHWRESVYIDYIDRIILEMSD